MNIKSENFKNKNITHVVCLVLCFFMFSVSLVAQTLKININKNHKFQTIDGFGASDAWRCQYVGANWQEDKKNKIAELLFSKSIDDNGNPKGIGLSIWRFYIGAGTMEQGDASGITNHWRRAESFIDYKGDYDWNKQKGQQWFLDQAKQYGVDKFLAFSISAPVHWTKNGKGYNDDTKDGEINLKPEYFDDYAEFMVNVVKHFNSRGFEFAYLSPINEPQWDWDKKSQEGTPATNNNILELTNLLNEKIKQSSLRTEIVLGESADLRWLYSNFGKPKRGRQIDYFFNKKDSLSTLKNLKNTISGHSYFTTWPIDSLITIRQNLNKQLESHKLNYWQSEFCILENTDDIGSGNIRDLGIDTALYVARVIHADLTLANASSWQWWTALTNANFKDGLIYLDTGDEKDKYNLDKMKFDGAFHDSKLLWAFGNYSRFIRPGMIRVKINVTDEENFPKDSFEGIMLSAYIDMDSSKLIVVGINYGDEASTIDFQDFKVESMYTTSKNKNLEFNKVIDKKITLVARSVNTLIGSF